jgi:hypothetical protein
MAALAPILLSTKIGGVVRTTDAAVGVDKTYSPEGWKQGNVASWVDRSGGVPLGYSRITYQLRPPTKESRIYKVSSKLYYPVLETIDPATGIFGPKLAYEIQAHLDCLIPERATRNERIYFNSLLRSSLFYTINALDDLPSDGTGSPIPNGIIELEDVY